VSTDTRQLADVAPAWMVHACFDGGLPLCSGHGDEGGSSYSSFRAARNSCGSPTVGAEDAAALIAGGRCVPASWCTQRARAAAAVQHVLRSTTLGLTCTVLVASGASNTSPAQLRGLQHCASKAHVLMCSLGSMVPRMSSLRTQILHLRWLLLLLNLPCTQLLTDSTVKTLIPRRIIRLRVLATNY
jgi:hypothetical protein